MNPETPNTPAIPEEIRNRIESASLKRWTGRRMRDVSHRNAFEGGAAYGYSIAQKEISTLEATIQEQDKQIIEKGKEIERLTKLVHEAFSKFRYRSFPHNEPTWEQFAKENNIQL